MKKQLVYGTLNFGFEVEANTKQEAENIISEWLNNVLNRHATIKVTDLITNYDSEWCFEDKERKIKCL